MDQFEIWASMAILVTIAALITPKFLRLNSSGNFLRNAALWLGIVVILVLIYQYFGPFHAADQDLQVNNAASAQKEDDSNVRPQLGGDGVSFR